jgi:hypothetical protein
MGDLRDRNDRAVRAYISPAVKGCGAAIPIHISNDSSEADINIGPGIVNVKSVQGPESPLGSGNYTFTVLVKAEMPLTVAPGADPQSQRILMSKLISAIHDALHVSDNNQDYYATAELITAAGNALAVDTSNGTEPAMVQSAADNADMVNYSALSVVHNILGGDKVNPENATYFVEAVTFQMNVVGYGGYWT